MWEVRGEDDHFGPYVVDDPAHGFPREGRNPDALAREIRGWAAGLCATRQRARPKIDGLQPRRNPEGAVLHGNAAQARVPTEDLVEDHGRQENFGAVVDGDEIQRAAR